MDKEVFIYVKQIIYAEALCPNCDKYTTARDYPPETYVNGVKKVNVMTCGNCFTIFNTTTKKPKDYKD